MIVLDASAVYELLLRTDASRRLAFWLENDPLVHAPYLLDLEVASTLRRGTLLGTFSSARALQALDDFRIMRINRHVHLPHLDRIWDLRNNFSAYDACYLALTEALGGTLLTRDKALGGARLRRGRVEVV